MAQREYLTIVSGLPRSGTSMMMRMLDAGGIPALTDHVRAADPSNPNGYYEYEPIKKTKEDPSWLPAAIGMAVKMVHVLLLDLPLSYAYRVLFMQRDIEEVIESQNRMLERLGKNSNDLPSQSLELHLPVADRRRDAVSPPPRAIISACWKSTTTP